MECGSADVICVSRAPFRFVRFLLPALSGVVILMSSPWPWSSGAEARGGRPAAPAGHATRVQELRELRARTVVRRLIAAEKRSDERLDARAAAHPTDPELFSSPDTAASPAAISPQAATPTTRATPTPAPGEAGEAGAERADASSSSSVAPPTDSAPTTVPTAPAPPSGKSRPTLRWAPPKLSNPTVIRLATGATHTSLSLARDYIVVLPPTEKVGGTWLDGGHNVVVVGGSITIPQGTTPGSANDWQRTGIYVSRATGTVHIEGVQIDGSGGADFDGIDINAPDATVQLENLRIVGVRGRYDGLHADIVQTWGGVHALRIDRLTGSSNYQGLTIPQDLGPMGSADISHVDLRDTEAPTTMGGHLLWLTTGSTTCSSFPTTLSDVYVHPRHTFRLDQAVWPDASGKVPCGPSLSANAVSWPGLPTVSGSVRPGSPPDGSYVPDGTAGPSYSSPGYAG